MSICSCVGGRTWAVSGAAASQAMARHKPRAMRELRFTGTPEEFAEIYRFRTVPVIGLLHFWLEAKKCSNPMTGT